jgi:hypothetical protein
VLCGQEVSFNNDIIKKGSASVAVPWRSSHPSRCSEFDSTGEHARMLVQKQDPSFELL